MHNQPALIPILASHPGHISPMWLEYEAIPISTPMLEWVTHEECHGVDINEQQYDTFTASQMNLEARAITFENSPCLFFSADGRGPIMRVPIG